MNHEVYFIPTKENSRSNVVVLPQYSLTLYSLIVYYIQ